MPKSISLSQVSRLGRLSSSQFGGGIRNRVIVRGATDLIRTFDKLNRAMPNKALDGLTRALLIVEAEAVRLITRGYYRPAVDTGRLRRSITHTITNFNPKFAEGYVGTNVYYALYVHEGTYFMEMRPFLVDALKNKQVQVQAILVDAFSDGITETIRKGKVV